MSKNKLITHILNEDKESYEKDSLEMINEITIFGFDPFKDNLLDLGIEKFDQFLGKMLNNTFNNLLDLFTAKGRLSMKMRSLRARLMKDLKALEKQKENAINAALKTKNYKSVVDIEKKNDTVKALNDEIEAVSYYITAAEKYIKARRKIFGSSYGQDDEGKNLSSGMRSKIKNEDEQVQSLFTEIIKMEEQVRTGTASSKTVGVQRKLDKKREELSRLLGIPIGTGMQKAGGTTTAGGAANVAK